MGSRVVTSLPTISYPWQTEYQAAVLEDDRTKLLKRIHLAEGAIFNRLQQLAQNNAADNHEPERQAITEAVGALGVLKRDKLGFPDWQKK